MWRFLWAHLFSNAHPPFETARQMARPPFWISRQKFFKSWPTEIAVNWSRTPERCGRLALRCSRCRSDMKWAALCRRLLHDSAPSKQLFLFLNALSREHSSFGDYHCTAGHQVYKVGFSCYITYKKQHFFVLGQVMETRCTVMLPSIVSVLCHNFEKEHTKGSIVAWRRQSWPYGHRYTRATPRYRVFMPKNWRLWILIHSWYHFTFLHSTMSMSTGFKLELFLRVKCVCTYLYWEHHHHAPRAYLRGNDLFKTNPISFLGGQGLTPRRCDKIGWIFEVHGDIFLAQIAKILSDLWI